MPDRTPNPGSSPADPVTYGGYLALDELLALQRPRSGGADHDEMLFIVIHQVYELWFKQVLHELDYLGSMLEAGDLPRAMHTFRRILTILKTAVGQVDILETMTPLEFESFRQRLESASGFQSAQFREVEFVLGARRPGVMNQFPEGSPERERLAARLQEPSLWDRFLTLLATRGIEVPAAACTRDVTKPVEPSPETQRVLIDLYRSGYDLADLCERMIDLDEGLQEWRYRHVKMVERTIGMKQGTGGSSGTDYLRSTLFRPLFPDLWAIRSEL